MRVFFDTEFIEDGHMIDLLSIGIVKEDGQTYYAINADCDLNKANEWVKKNVLKQLPEKYIIADTMGSKKYNTNAGWKSKIRIKEEVLAFIGQDNPEIWAYYASYDWVVLCQLFGTMTDLPKGWPMYCRDIQQYFSYLGNPELPKQETKEHNALNDALWNKQAFEFLERYDHLKNQG